MSEGPTIGDWMQYGWIPDEAWSFPARVRLRDAAWMVYYEPNTVVQRERAENAKLRELLTYAAQSVDCDVNGKKCPLHSECVVDGRFIGCAFEMEVRELGIEVD